MWKAGRWQSDILAAIVIINDSSNSGNAADPDCSIACMEQVLVMEPLSTNWRGDEEAAFACLDKSVSGDNHKLKLSMTPWRNIWVGGKQPITASLHLSFSKREGAAKWWGKHMSIQKWIYHYQISQENKNLMEGNKRRITMLYKLSCDLHNMSHFPISFLSSRSFFFLFFSGFFCYEMSLRYDGSPGLSSLHASLPKIWHVFWMLLKWSILK